MSQISIAQLFEDKRQKLDLTWEGGRDGSDSRLDDDAISRSMKGIIGHVNLINPNW